VDRRKVVGVVLLPQRRDLARCVGAVPGGGVARSGLSGWAKKNECRQAAANRASVRASASATGTLSSTARWVTPPGWSIAVRIAT
jgi:hypothetical protein